MRILKPLVGIVLIVVSVFGLIWWEKEGRQELLMVDVVVAKDGIEKGETLSRKHVQVVKSMKENLIDGALDMQGWEKLKGKVVKQYIPKNAQLNEEMVIAKEELLKENQSIFVLQPHWIYSRSSSLRKGDLIDIYDSNGDMHLGTYTVAYAKDEGEQEIITTEGSSGEGVLEREFSSGVIYQVEIIAQLEEYEKLRVLAEEQGMSFLLVQKGV